MEDETMVTYETSLKKPYLKAAQQVRSLGGLRLRYHRWVPSWLLYKSVSYLDHWRDERSAVWDETRSREGGDDNQLIKWEAREFYLRDGRQKLRFPSVSILLSRQSKTQGMDPQAWWGPLLRFPSSMKSYSVKG